MGFAAAAWLQPPKKLEQADREGFKALAGQVRGWLRAPPRSWQRIDHLVYLEVARPWCAYGHFRWTPPGQRTLTTTIGALHDLGLWGILERGREMREKLRGDGIDPREERRKRQPTKALAEIWPDFRASQNFAPQANRRGGPSQKHEAEAVRFWERYLQPSVGSHDAARVASDDILEAIRPVFETTTHGDRIYNLVLRLFDYVVACKLRPDNPARDLKPRLPTKSNGAITEHLAACPWRRVPEYMARLRERSARLGLTRAGIATLATEATILCCARSSELRLAHWSWYDPEAAVLTIPAKSEKTRNGFRRPVPARAAEIFAMVEPLRESVDGLIFPAGPGGKPLQDTELSHAARSATPPGLHVTLHGTARGSFRTWADDTGQCEHDLAERCLGHVIRNKAQAAYRHSDMLERRRSVVNAWAVYCCSDPVGGGEVVPLRQGRLSEIVA
jgi:integrase